MTDRWRGIRFEVRPATIHVDRYEVEFWPNELMAARGPDGDFAPIERGTVVTLENASNPSVIGFHPAEHQYSDLQRHDYEEKAIEALREFLASENAEHCATGRTAP